MSNIIFNELKAKQGVFGEIILNRPKALNALSYEMIMLMLDKLTTWQQADAIKAVIVRSNSEKAFCAGGDVVNLYHQGLESPTKPMPFFKHEYHLNCLIRDFGKPYIALLDGITMGGGVGISLHGNFAIATENFSFAMPETGIGFFPDVGGSYLLTRCNHNFGNYLALTGKRIGLTDVMQSGLVNYSIKASEQQQFIDLILTSDLTQPVEKVIDDLLTRLSKPELPESSFFEIQDEVEAIFGLGTIEEIFSALSQLDTSWARKTLSILQSKSPTALKVTLAQMQRGKNLSMREAMNMEYRIVSRFMEGTEFYEGVRALLVDKDKNPQWAPHRLEDISQIEVDKYFAPLTNELWD